MSWNCINIFRGHRDLFLSRAHSLYRWESDEDQPKPTTTKDEPHHDPSSLSMQALVSFSSLLFHPLLLIYILLSSIYCVAALSTANNNPNIFKMPNILTAIEGAFVCYSVLNLALASFIGHYLCFCFTRIFMK